MKLFRSLVGVLRAWSLPRYVAARVRVTSSARLGRRLLLCAAMANPFSVALAQPTMQGQVQP
ncbi:MAG: hypothetical protein WCP99_24385, partial [Burkholderiales bacterium]